MYLEYVVARPIFQSLAMLLFAEVATRIMVEKQFRTPMQQKAKRISNKSQVEGWALAPGRPGLKCMDSKRQELESVMRAR